MEGLRTGVARTDVFRVDPYNFEEGVSIAQNAEHYLSQQDLVGMGTTQAI